jgi:hypothetical protein
MRRLRGCLMVAFIFACGFLVGGFLGVGIGMFGFFHKLVNTGPRAISDTIVDRAVHDLKLNPGQSARVRKIVDETSAELAAATAAVRPQIGEIIGRAEERVREVLDARQRKKFDSFLKEGRPRWQAAVRPVATPPPPQPAEPVTAPQQ